MIGYLNKLVNDWHIWVIFGGSLLLVFTATGARSDTGVVYKAEIKGIEDDAIYADLSSVANTLILEKRYPATLNGLRQRARSDVERFYKVLKSYGYYDSNVLFSIDQETQPAKVQFTIDKGPRFVLSAIEYQWLRQVTPKDLKLPAVNELGLVIGDPVHTDKILKTKETIVNSFALQGYPFAVVKAPKVIVDYQSKKIVIRYEVDSGEIQYFGEVRITGLVTVEEGFIRKKIPWKAGERFDSEKIKTLRTDLTKTALFKSVKITPVQQSSGVSQLPVLITLEESEHRTVRIGLSYKTDEGFGTKASWENRNLFRKGENFKTEIAVSDLETSVTGTFQKPDFLKKDQSLLYNFRLASEHTDAYDSKTFDNSMFVERNIGYGRRFSLGCAFELSQVKQLDEKDEFALLSLPAYYNWDFSDDLFDPRRGGHFQIKLAPFINTIYTDIRFLKGSIGYSHYITLINAPLIIFASHITVGGMGGVSRDDIPANIRFYAGGGGTIRGYAYQAVGPMEGDEAIGGRSLATINNEFRFKITESIGLVLFLDGGNAYEQVTPKFGELFQWGYGVGFRYFTLVGPLRVDFGMPLNPREAVDDNNQLYQIDDSYQLYVSIGHAF